MYIYNISFEHVWHARQMLTALFGEYLGFVGDPHSVSGGVGDPPVSPPVSPPC
jgi:hypothetical protein